MSATVHTRVTHLTTATRLQAGTPEQTEGALLAQGWVHSGATPEELVEHKLHAILQHPQLAGDRLYLAATPVEVDVQAVGE